MAQYQARIRRQSGSVRTGWGATLAIVPVLLSAYAVQLQHFVLSDTLFAFLVMLAVALMMWLPDPPVWSCAGAVALLHLSA